MGYASEVLEERATQVLLFLVSPPACFRETCFQKSLRALFCLVFSNRCAQTREILLLYLTLFPERDLFSVLSVTKTIPSRPGPVA